jgi:alanine-glyoxylate transaminase/serine-glyoxylate transaminase/serine-pyruvate transaminase
MTHTGRHFLQIPGPTNVPDRVLKEIAQATIDHRGPEFADLGLEVLERLKGVFRTSGPVVVFPSSGTGAAEAALVNTLSPGDRILIFETGWFSHIAWRQVAERLGVEVEYVPGTWRRGASPDKSRRHRAQRNVDRGRQPHPRPPARNEPERPSGAVDRRRHLIARLDRSAA